MVTIIRDGLTLSYGYFETMNNYSIFEIQRGYDLGGNPLSEIRQYRVLRLSDGITTFKDEEDMQKFLKEIGPHKVFAVDLVHRKFYADRDTLMELSF